MKKISVNRMLLTTITMIKLQRNTKLVRKLCDDPVIPTVSVCLLPGGHWLLMILTSLLFEQTHCMKIPTQRVESTDKGIVKRKKMLANIVWTYNICLCGIERLFYFNIFSNSFKIYFCCN